MVKSELSNIGRVHVSIIDLVERGFRSPCKAITNII